MQDEITALKQEVAKLKVDKAKALAEAEAVSDDDDDDNEEDYELKCVEFDDDCVTLYRPVNVN